MARPLDARVEELEALVKIILFAFTQALQIDPQAIAAQKGFKP